LKTLLQIFKKIQYDTFMNSWINQNLKYLEPLFDKFMEYNMICKIDDGFDMPFLNDNFRYKFYSFCYRVRCKDIKGKYL